MRIFRLCLLSTGDIVLLVTQMIEWLRGSLAPRSLTNMVLVVRLCGSLALVIGLAALVSKSVTDHHRND